MKQTFRDSLRKVVTGIIFLFVVILGALAFNIAGHFDGSDSSFVRAAVVLVNATFVYLFIVTLIRISSNSNAAAEIIDNLNTRDQINVLDKRIDSLRENQDRVRERMYFIERHNDYFWKELPRMIAKEIELFDLQKNGVDLTKKTEQETAAAGVDLTEKK